MRYAQFLILEAGTGCNYATIHPACPVSDARRFECLDTSRSLDIDSMVKIATRAYTEFGFRGLVGYHYYNEPLLYREKILEASRKIKAAVPSARFVLWTNGYIIRPTNVAELAIFDQVYVTDYDNRDWGFLREVCPDGQTIRVRFDDRRHAPIQDNRERCLRPWVEFVVDYHGNVHLCCTDWRGLASPGNLLTGDMADVVARFRDYRASVSGQTMSETAPAACKLCGRRWNGLDTFDAQIAADARQEISRLQMPSRPRRWVEPAARAVPVATPQIPRRPQLLASVASVPPRTRIAPPGWAGRNRATVTEPRGSAGPVYGAGVPLFAILSTWYEADIIEAAVKNAFVQGCDEVYVIDNKSPDDTVERAVAAGAKVAEVWGSDFYQEDDRLRRINAAVWRITAERGLPALWWLGCDADELVAMVSGETVRAFVEQLPTRYNVVGANCLDYYPTPGQVANVPGEHPGRYQSLAVHRDARRAIFCHRKHWKHPLICLGGSEPDLGWDIGLHSVIGPRGGRPSVEPIEEAILHHFPLREYEQTRRRMEALCVAGTVPRNSPDVRAIGPEGPNKRLRDLDLIYAGRWSECEMPHGQEWQGVKGIPVEPVPARLAASWRVPGWEEAYSQSSGSNSLPS